MMQELPSAGARWQPVLPPIPSAGESLLTPVECQAITLLLARRAHPAYRRRWSDLPEGHSLQRLLKPLRGALAQASITPCGHSAAVGVLLQECLQVGRACWGWRHDHWTDVLGRHSRAFHDRHHGRAQQCTRIDMAAVAYLYGWFRDVLALGEFQRVALAQRVFGPAALETAWQQTATRLQLWGYAVHTPLLSCLAEALLRNQSPYLESLTAEALDCFRRTTRRSRCSQYFQLAKALAAGGMLPAPLPSARPTPVPVHPDRSSGMATEWYDWVDRWWRISTIASRNHVRLYLCKTGRWLAATHADTVSPAQWTRELAIEYVAAVARQQVGEYTVRTAGLRRQGQPLSPHTMAGQLGAARTFFSDCQEWGWIPRRFDPYRSLAVPRSIKALIGPKPRLIADDVWARLLWAGLHLEQTDLTRDGRPALQAYPYPLAHVRAVALVWLFAGLRSNEISRLRVGCVRWQHASSEPTGGPVCLLDVPSHKTGTDFTKPVDPLLGRAIAAWQDIRPMQPQSVDRKTGEYVDLLFTYRARPIRPQLINQSIIPILCRKAGVPLRDARGPITSHRARATIASQLFNSRQPMSLSELQAWLGHVSAASTQHYVAVAPTKLAQAYTDAGYFERNIRAIHVLIDRDTMKEALAAGEPWRYYDLGHGLCAYEFFEQCAHRMACARCDFYHPRQSTIAQLLEAKGNLLRFLQQIPLTDEERTVVDGDLVAIDRLAAKLADCPTPSGQTPAQLQGAQGPAPTAEA